MINSATSDGYQSSPEIDFNYGTQYGSTLPESDKFSRASNQQPKTIVMNDKDKMNMTISPNFYGSISSFTSDTSSLDQILFRSIIAPTAAYGGPFDNHSQITSEDFSRAIGMAKDGIRAGVNPERIYTGTSGSYYVKSRYGRILGVFKPKDEEPYSKMNPKWSKWIHRACCPCCFGRSCILVGSGYISEAAASAVDRFFKLGMIPRTEITELGAPSFHYELIELWRAWRRKPEDLESAGTKKPYTVYKSKIGSFQMYVEDYRDAEEIITEIHEMPCIRKDLNDAFQKEFEKLVILDYAIRNTDRGLDNLLMKIDWTEDDNSGQITKSSNDEEQSVPKRKPLKPIVHMAAIDNGLAFPYKHPDNWRSYPFGWASLPNVYTPFSKDITRHMLDILLDRDNWDALEEELRDIFKIDIGFREVHFQRQMSVLRGQLRNIVDCLQAGGKTPFDLVNMQPIIIQEQDMYLRDVNRAQRMPLGRIIKGQHDEEDSTEGHPRWKRIITDQPVFKSF